jgi:hypothetical protein
MAGHVQQQPSKGLKPIGRIGLSDSDRGIGLPKRDREDKPRPGTTVVNKKKQKPKTAAAGGGMNPPSKPPKGPTGGGPKNPKNIGKGNEPDDYINKKPKKPEPQSPKNPKGRQFEGGLQRNPEGQKPRDYKKPDVKVTRDQQGHSSSMGGFKKSIKKDK